METHFTLLDGFVLFAYLAGTTALGVWLGRDQKNAKDYFVGNGALPWWAILISIVATETSALTFISIPGLAYLGNLTFLQITIGYLLGRIVIAYTLLPRYYGGEMVTAYALLERRFGLPTRRFASITFMVTRVFGDSVRVFVTAIPIAFIVGPLVPEGWGTPAAILLLGASTLVFTYQGGMRAVVWTDVIQTVVYLVAGIAAFIVIGQGVEGGWGAIFSRASSEGKMQIFDLHLGIDKPYTLLAGVLGGGFLAMASHGTDQMIVQRLVAASSLKDAQKALIGSGLVVIAQMVLFLVIGTGLYVFYNGQKFDSPDTIFPRFIMENMPSGLTGLVVAAILAASTVSGALNSLSAATLHDIYMPLAGRPKDDATLMRLSKLFTLLWAIVLIGGALLFKDNKTPVVTVALAIASFTYGGLLGGFFLGILWPRATQRDALIGMSAGIALMIVVVFSKTLSQYWPALKPLALIAWPWYVLIGTSITFITGVVSSAVAPAPMTLAEPQRPLTR